MGITVRSRAETGRRCEFARSFDLVFARTSDSSRSRAAHRLRPRGHKMNRERTWLWDTRDSITWRAVHCARRGCCAHLWRNKAAAKLRSIAVLWLRRGQLLAQE